MRSSAVRPGPVHSTIARPAGTRTATQSAAKPSGCAWSQDEAARKRPAAGPQRSGGTTPSSTGTNQPPAAHSMVTTATPSSSGMASAFRTAAIWRSRSSAMRAAAAKSRPASTLP